MSKRNKKYLRRLKPASTLGVEWVLDQDYISTLSRQEKEWLSQFNSEFYFGSFFNDGDDFIDPDQRKPIQNARNSRYRDAVVNQLREDYLKEVSKKITYSPADYASDATVNPEEALIEFIDLKTQKEKESEDAKKKRTRKFKKNVGLN